VFASLSLLLRHLLAWAAALFVAGMVWSGIFSGMNDGPGWIFGLLAMFLIISALGSAITHIRRVWLVAGRLDATTLSGRQRRQIELPMDAGHAFSVVEAAIAELPRVEDVESSAGSLQVRAYVRRVDLWNGRQPSRWNLPARLAIKRNSVLATVTPGQGTSTATLLFEPDAGWWADLLALDEGSNFENAEAVTRAISRRVADQRRDEQAAAEQTQVEKELSVARLNLLRTDARPPDPVPAQLVAAGGRIGVHAGRGAGAHPRLPGDSAYPHGRAAGGGSAGTQRTAWRAPAGDGVADTGGKRDQARPGTQARRWHDLDPRAWFR